MSLDFSNPAMGRTDVLQDLDFDSFLGEEGGGFMEGVRDEPAGVKSFATAASMVSQDISERRKRRRKRYAPGLRSYVQRVRKIGACSECRARKVRVCQPVLCSVKVIPLLPSSVANLGVLVQACTAGGQGSS